MIGEALKQDPKELHARVEAAKYYLSQYANITRAVAENIWTQEEIHYFNRVLHEATRVGVRNLNEIQFMRLQRVLTQIEKQMQKPYSMN
jgi:hypothetical protein